MLSDEQQRRLEQEINSLEQLYQRQKEKIDRLRNALIIETDPLRKFQYEQQVQQEENELKKLTNRIDEIENQLQSAPSLKLGSQQGKLLSDIPVTGFEVSEVGADYTKLRDLLSVQKFQEADEETFRVMLWAVRREKEGWLEEKNILNFPYLDLYTINKLWLASSDGKFGFSVQKQISIDVGVDYNPNLRGFIFGYLRFMIKVDWINLFGGEFMIMETLHENLENLSEEKKYYLGYFINKAEKAPIKYDLRATKGHLPFRCHDPFRFSDFLRRDKSDSPLQAGLNLDLLRIIRKSF